MRLTGHRTYSGEEKLQFASQSKNDRYHVQRHSQWLGPNIAAERALGLWAEPDIAMREASISSPAATRENAIQWHKPTAATAFGLPRIFILAVLVACAYYGGTKLGLLFTPPSQAVSTLWPPNALVFAALLLTPLRTWPILLAAVLPVHMFVQLRSGIPELTAAGWYLTNMSEALLGAACLRAFCVRHRIVPHKLFESFRGVIAFLLLGVLFAPLVTSFLDAAVVVKTGWGLRFWTLWRERSLSNMLANLTLIPPLVVIGSNWRSMLANKRRYLEVALLTAAIVLIAGLAFGTKGTAHSVPLLIYLLLPFLLWAAVRLGSGGASAVLLLVAVLSIWNAMHDRGPFGLPERKVLALQIFLSAISVPLLCLAATLAERRSVEDRLRQQQRLLNLVAQIAASFLTVDWDKIDHQIKQSLARLCEFLAADRASVFEVASDHGDLRRAYTLSRGEDEEVSSHRTPLYEVDWALNKLRLGHDVWVPVRSQLPGDAVEREAMAERGIESTAIARLGTQNSLAAILCVGSRTEKQDWPPDLLPQLHVLGEIFCNAMQRKKALQALTESEQRFRHTADHSPMLVWMSDSSGLCTYFNRSWLDFTGVALERQLGNGWTHLVHADDIAECLSTYKSAFEAHREFKMEYRLRRHDGEYRWVLDIGVPRFDGEGTFLGCIGSAVDVTEHRNAQEAIIGLAGRVIKAQDEERHRIARELHDDVGQRLTLLMIDLNRVQRDADSSLQQSVLQLLNEAQSISECVRNISHNLHPARVDLLPLGVVLRSMCREFTQRTSIEFRFAEHDVPARLPLEVKTCLYRVAQEAFQNIVKHSRAHRAAVALVGHGDRDCISLRVDDDGVGFVGNQQRAADGLGMASMRERLASIGGTFEVTTAPNQGTRIMAYVPLPDAPVLRLAA